jgi:hypothetical protein
MKKDPIIMFLLGLSTLLFLYIPQFPARYREYVGVFIFLNSLRVIASM